jgi:hypothetical protein
VTKTPRAPLSNKAKRAMGAMVVVAVVAITISRQVGAADNPDGVIRDAKPVGTFLQGDRGEPWMI